EPGQNDELLINGLNICTETLCPWKKLVNAYFAFNWEGKEETTLKEDPVTSALPFIQGAQVYIPASSPPNATVKYQLKSRLGGGRETGDGAGLAAVQPRRAARKLRRDGDLNRAPIYVLAGGRHGSAAINRRICGAFVGPSDTLDQRDRSRSSARVRRAAALIR